MAVLSVIGTVLLIILFIILGLIALVVFLLLLIFFSPIKYKADITAKSENGLSSTKTDMSVRVRWLFGLVRFTYLDGKAIIKVLWIRLNAEKAVEETIKALPTVAADTFLEPDINLAHTIIEDLKEGREAEKAVEAESCDKVKSSGEATSDEDNGKSKFKKIMDRIIDIKQKYTAIVNHPDRHEIQKLALILLRKMKKILKPKTFCVTGKIGFATPDKTGMLLGATYALRSMTDFKINIEGDFDNEIVDINAQATDKLNLFQIAYPIARFCLNKKVRPIVFGLIKNR